MFLIVLSSVSALALPFKAVLGETLSSDIGSYEIHYTAQIKANRNFITATISLSQTRDYLRALNFKAPKALYRGFKGDGEIQDFPGN